MDRITISLGKDLGTPDALSYITEIVEGCRNLYPDASILVDSSKVWRDKTVFSATAEISSPRIQQIIKAQLDILKNERRKKADTVS